eukprot:UC4_evm2s250
MASRSTYEVYKYMRTFETLGLGIGHDFELSRPQPTNKLLERWGAPPSLRVESLLSELPDDKFIHASNKTRNPLVAVFTIDEILLRPVFVSRAEITTKALNFSSRSAFLIAASKNRREITSLHYWLGKNADFQIACICVNSAQLLHQILEEDPRRAASIKVEREVHPNESSFFLELFPQARDAHIDSGTESLTGVGLKTTRLFWVNGSDGNQSMVKIEEVSGDSPINSGDVYVVEDPSNGLIIQWNGMGSIDREQEVGGDFVKSLLEARSHRHSRVYKFEDNPEVDDLFWRTLGRKRCVLVGHDISFSKQCDTKKDVAVKGDLRNMWAVQYHNKNWNPCTSRKFSVKKLTKIPITISTLDKDCVYIIDAGSSGFFVWHGIETTFDMQTFASSKALAIHQKLSLPSWISIRIVKQDKEEQNFVNLFSEKTLSIKDGIRSTHNFSMSDSSDIVEEETDESLKDEHFRILSIEEVKPTGQLDNVRPINKVLVFYSHTCYIVTALNIEEDELTFWCWVGCDACENVQKLAATIAHEKNDELARTAVVVIVPQGTHYRLFHIVISEDYSLIEFMTNNLPSEKDLWKASNNFCRLFGLLWTKRGSCHMFELDPNKECGNNFHLFAFTVGKNRELHCGGSNTLFIWDPKQVMKSTSSNNLEANLRDAISTVFTSFGIRYELQIISCLKDIFVKSPTWDCIWKEIGPQLEKLRLLRIEADESGICSFFDLNTILCEHLKQNSIVMLETNWEVFVWIGAAASFCHKMAVVKILRAFGSQRPIHFVSGGAEPKSFKLMFMDCEAYLEEGTVKPYK